MTWWTLPSVLGVELAKRWLKAGANEGLMGWKARCRVAGRRAEALNDLAMPLESAVESAGLSSQKLVATAWSVPAEHFDGSREGIDGSGEVMEMEVGLLGG
jgi:hypothetical protein